MTPPLGEFLKTKRGSVSREALATRAREMAPGVEGIHRTAIERWEIGTSIPGADQLEAVCRALGLSDADRAIAMRGAAPRSGTPAAA
jgi:transcriptional regulator with XRE-family HTH domain